MGGPSGPVWTDAENLSAHRDSIPGLSSPNRVTMPTELSRPTFICVNESLKHFSIYNVWCYQAVILYTLSMSQQRRYQMKRVEKTVGKNGRWCFYSKTFKRLPLSFTDCHCNVILNWNRLLYSVNGMAGSDGHSRMLGGRTAFVGPVTSATLRCSCTPLTIMCCHHRRPRDANIFRVLPMASGRGSTIIFKGNLFVNFFKKELMKTN